MSAFTTGYPMMEVIQRRTDGGVPCGAINSIADIFEDPQFEARENLQTVHEPGAGDIVIPGVIPKLSETPGRVTHLGPAFKNGTEQIFGELLGLSPERIRELLDREII